MGKGELENEQNCNAIPRSEKKNKNDERKGLGESNQLKQHIEMQSTREQVQNDETRPCFCNLHKKRKVKKKMEKDEREKKNTIQERRSLQSLEAGHPFPFWKPIMRREEEEEKFREIKGASNGGRQSRSYDHASGFCRISQSWM
jgi:hypothetical protein